MKLPQEEFDTENSGVLLGRAMIWCWVFYPDECGMGLANACGDDGVDVPLLLFVSGKMCLWLGQSQTPYKTRQNQNECPVARMEKEW